MTLYLVNLIRMLKKLKFAPILGTLHVTIKDAFRGRGFGKLHRILKNLKILRFTFLVSNILNLLSDSDDDCLDGSDEKNCTSKLSNYFRVAFPGKPCRNVRIYF